VSFAAHPCHEVEVSGFAAHAAEAFDEPLAKQAVLDIASPFIVA
jgi:hypothetical protein